MIFDSPKHIIQQMLSRYVQSYPNKYLSYAFLKYEVLVTDWVPKKSDFQVYPESAEK